MDIVRLILRLSFAAAFVHPFLLAQPSISIAGGDRFEMGDVYNGATARHQITIRNDGKDTLVISNVRAACGCTGTILSNSRLAPGDTGSISVSFNSAAFLGPVEKSITVSTNDPARANIDIHFTANAVRILTFDPEYIFLRSGSDSTSQTTVTITNTCTRKVKIRSLVPKPDILAIQLSNDVLQPGEEATLTASLKGSTPGTQAGDIEISIDFPGVPTMNLRYFAWTREKETTSGRPEK